MTTLRSGATAQTNTDKPSLAYGPVTRMTVKGTTRHGWIRFPYGNALRPGVVIHSADMQLEQVGSWTAAVEAKRPIADWNARTITGGDSPALTGTTVTATRTGTTLHFDVAAHLQTMVDQEDNNGWRIATADTVAREILGFGADTGSPVLVVEFSYPPAQPTDLNPSGSKAVSLTKPTLQFTADDFAWIKVQIDPTGAFTSPTFDSGWVATTVPELDLATTTYGGLTSGSTSWRVRVRNSSLDDSPWSTTATFSRVAKPALTFVTPTTTVWESTPPFNVDMTGMTEARFRVFEGTERVYDSKPLATTTGEHTPPKPVFTTDGGAYRIVAWAWDAVDRADTPGDPPYVSAEVTVTLDTDPAVTGVTSLVATSTSPSPPVTLTFARATAPDALRIKRNGTMLADDVPYSDLDTSGTTYAFTDLFALPNVPNVYKVQAVVNGKASTPATVTITPFVASHWIIDPETGDAVVIHGKDALAWNEPERSVIHETDDSVVRRRFGRRPPEGSIDGIITTAPAFPGRTVETMADLLEGWAEGSSSKVFQLVSGDKSIPAWIGDVNLSRSGLSRPGDVVKAVSLNFWRAT